jgi:hypothetical protein
LKSEVESKNAVQLEHHGKGVTRALAGELAHLESRSCLYSSRSPMSAPGRKLMAANGCFGDAEPKGSRAAHLNGRFAACFVGDVVISAVTLAELEFGIACSSLAVQATNQSRRAAR